MKIIKEIVPYIIIILFVFLIRTFLVTPVRVNGSSMLPTLKHNDILLLKKYDKKFERFDIIVLKSDNEKLIKRVIGFPGEMVEYKNHVLYINNTEVEDEYASLTEDFNIVILGYDVIPNDMYFVLGDNRESSSDSRYFGFVELEDILGAANFRLFPLNKIGKTN